MKHSFTIHFNYPLADTIIVFKLKADATLHHSDPYYIVNNFKIAGRNDTKYDVLPEVKIKKVKEGEEGEPVWVHCDSGRPTELSILLGKEIDQHEEKMHDK